MKNERLIRARIQCGYTQSEIAAKAKISLRAYQNYESGRRCPNVSVARLISQELNVPMDELFEPLSQPKRRPQNDGRGPSYVLLPSFSFLRSISRQASTERRTSSNASARPLKWNRP